MDKDAAQLDFLNRIQRILNEGSFVASYKYALLISIAELCIEEKAGTPDGSLHLPLRDVAERFVGLYWRQAGPFGANAYLRHNTGKEAAAVSRIRAFQAYAPTIAAARAHPRWDAMISSIVRLLIDMPLWRLQVVGQETMDFLYANELANDGIVLRPGIADCFRQQFTVVQALVQMAWLSFIQRLPANRQLLGASGDLADFLFGSERSGLTMLVTGLRDVQHGDCFYCRRPLQDAVEVDHFIPWSRYPRDLGHNFVLAHDSCNRDKRDMLAAPVHLSHWLDRNAREDSALQQIFDGSGFLFDLDASSTVVEWQYELAERSSALVWLAKRGQTEKLSAGWRDIFGQR